MLQEQTIKASTLELIKKHMSDSDLKDFYLNSVTALTLKI